MPESKVLTIPIYVQDFRDEYHTLSLLPFRTGDS